MKSLQTILQKWTTWLPWSATLLGPLAIFLPPLLQGKVLFWGAPLLQFTPWHWFARTTLREGFLPLWNPHLGFGAPLLANHQSALLYPPNWLLYLFDPAWIQTFLVMLHLIWAGIGMVMLLKKVGLHPTAQAVGALTFSISGYLVSRSGFLSVNATAAWLPWVVFLSHNLVVLLRDPTTGQVPRLRRAILLLGIGFALQWLAGHAQTAIFSLLLAVIWAVFAVDRAGRRWKVEFLGFSAALLLGLVLALAQILPTLEYLLVSSRSLGLGSEFGLNYSFWPWRLLSLFAPTLFGHPADSTYWGYGNYWEDDLYIGVLPLLLVGIAILRRGVPHTRLRRLMILVSGGAFLFALGKNTPVYPWLYETIPGLDAFQAPTRWNLLTTFSLSILAGLGIQYSTEPTGKYLYWLRLGAAGAVAMGIAALLGGQVLDNLNPTFSPAIAVAAFGLFLSVVVLLLRQEAIHFSWSGAIVVLLTVDLARMGILATPTTGRDLHHGTSALLEHVDSEHRIFMPEPIEQELKFRKAFRFDSFHAFTNWVFVRDVGLPNVTLLDQLRSANNFDPLVPSRYQSFIGRLQTSEPPVQIDRLQLADIGWLATPSTEVPSGIRFLELESPARVRLVGESIWVESVEVALDRVFDSQFEIDTSVILEGRPSKPTPPMQVEGEIQIQESRDPNLVSLRISSSTGGWVVLSDQWYPGWQASLDGEEVESYPANVAFRAVFMPAGDHSLSFTYRPMTFIAGGGISLLAWIIVLVGIRKWRE